MCGSLLHTLIGTAGRSRGSIPRVHDGVGRKDACVRCAHRLSRSRTAPPRNVECVGSQHDVGHVRRSAAPPALTMKESRERETMDHPRGGPAALTHTRTLCSLSIPPDPTGREVGVRASSSARPCGRWWRSNTLSARRTLGRAPLLLPLRYPTLSLCFAGVL